MMSDMVSTRGRVVTGQMGVGTAAFQAGPNALLRTRLGCPEQDRSGASFNYGLFTKVQGQRVVTWLPPRISGGFPLPIGVRIMGVVLANPLY
jgi:hypothetical protein